MIVNISSVKQIYFSPTRTTKRIVEGIVEGIGIGKVELLDLTPPGARTRDFKELVDELAIIGAPVYNGRIPIDAVHRLQRLGANGTPAVVVVVYGNREYEDALLELRDLAVEAGFKPIAAGAFIGEHSFSSESTPLASGRPDVQDLKKATRLGERVREKLGDIRPLDEVPLLRVPGNFPYKKRGKPLRASPTTRAELCTRCGECVALCPTAAIVVGETVVTDRDACILCCACIKDCPSGARVMDDARIQKMVEWLGAKCRERKEPEVYI